MKIDLKIRDKFMTFEKTSILDTIAIYRTNEKYLDLLRKYEIDQ
jgi:hypothetical protein